MRKIFLLVLLILMGCANERLVALKQQYKNVKAEIPNSCHFFSSYFEYDSNNNIQYVSSYSSQTGRTYQTLTVDTDDDIFNKLLKTCEICTEEHPEYAATYMEYKESILKVQKEKEEKIKAAKIAEEEKLKKKKEEETKKIALSKKYNAEWCDNGILSQKDRCLLEGEFQIIEQHESGTLVKPRISINYAEIQMIAAISQYSALLSMTTGRPDEVNQNLNDMVDGMQQFVFIESNFKDSKQFDGAVVKGLFLRDGVYRYTSLIGIKTVKKIRRLQ